MRSTPGTTAERARPDWTVLRQRLEQARSRLQESFAVAPERQREILRARSRAIAAPPPAAAKEAMVSVVEFSLAYEQYALELRYVAELALL
ncbi:MAG TPA: hypothetical protein VHF69_05855, partial [Candidatus Synoicihabitans sp.]|nr:hypothetical protein [Candidatus Synoicihabitans sp.]